MYPNRLLCILRGTNILVETCLDPKSKISPFIILFHPLSTFVSQITLLFLDQNINSFIKEIFKG